MKRVLFFIITCSLVAAVPRDKQAQVSVCPSFSRTYRLLKILFHYSKLLEIALMRDDVTGSLVASKRDLVVMLSREIKKTLRSN